LIIPDDIDLQYEAKDLILKLLTKTNYRIGVNEIKNHPFF